MIKLSDNFEPEFRAEKPTRLIPVGSIDGVYLSKNFTNSFLFNKTYIFPLILEHKGKIKLGYFFDMPAGYDGKCYKLYRLEKENGISTYLPVPRFLRPILADASKRPLISYSIGFSNGSMVILLERYDGK